MLTHTLSLTLRLRAKVLSHVWSYDFYDTEIITWAFRDHLIYQPETPISDRGFARGPYCSRADISDDTKNPCYDLFII